MNATIGTDAGTRFSGATHAIKRGCEKGGESSAEGKTAAGDVNYGRGKDTVVQVILTDKRKSRGGSKWRERKRLHSSSVRKPPPGRYPPL